MSTPSRHPGLRLARSLAVFLLAVALTTVAGSLIQTQINLSYLSDLGANIEFSDRLATTMADLVGFTPFYALVVFTSLVLAFPVAALLGRFWLPRQRSLLFVLAGVSGLLTGFAMLNVLTPPPTLIAATRGLPGALSMAACAGLAGWLYAILTDSGRPTS